MPLFVHPALASLIQTLSLPSATLRFGPVQLTSMGPTYQLRHLLDATTPVESLRIVESASLRDLVNHAENKAFRPNKAAPNLVQGWLCQVNTASELRDALETILPGGLADWFAASQTGFKPLDFRTFAGRQSGMYRTVDSLSDPDACEVTRACCDSRFCSRRRLWSVGQSETDSMREKSDVPCLEPCALLLELARRAHRLNQQERSTITLSEGDLATLAAAINIAVAHTDPTLREGDLSDSSHPRRLMLLREKLLPWLPAATLSIDG